MRRESRVSEVRRELHERIRSGSHPAGTLLPSERLLSSSLRVSRTVLREAVRELEMEGLLEVRHGVGIGVVENLHRPVKNSMSLLMPDLNKRLLHLMEARLLIEPPLAGLAAKRCTRKDWAQLALSQKDLKNATTAQEAMQADLRFHHAIAAASGNDVIKLMLDAAADLGRESRMVTLTHFGFETAYKHHAQIFKAIKARQSKRADNLMRSHLKQASLELGLQLKSTK